MFIETSFHLLFPDNVPLIPLEDMFIEYNPSKNNPYTLNILMKLAETDLKIIIQKLRPHSMSFREFFPVFKDSILGLTYMHIHNIAHRDIKPANLMKMAKDKFALADYGIGINL